MNTKLLLLVAVFSFVFTGLKAQVDVGDSLALVDLYNSTGGKRWVHHTNWLTKEPVSTWFGITLFNRKVINIQLLANNLTGPFPTSIGDFDSLINVSFDRDFLTGSIPSTIGNLKTLEVFDFSYNLLSGNIPSTLGNIPSLKGIYLSNCNLTGEIPASLQYAHSCRTLLCLQIN